MGQFHDKGSRDFDEDLSRNGLIFADRYLPKELLTSLLCYVDYKSLLNCQLVCKQWNILIQDYVWRKVTEQSVHRPLSFGKDVPWPVYYLICHKKPFERNLVKNHSGAQGLRQHWQILSDGGDKWTVENPPAGIPPLPSNEPTLEGKQFCFATSYYKCTKIQIIDLETEGLAPHILDVIQPPITVSEWYGCRFDCSGIYECVVQLFADDERLLDAFKFRKTIAAEEQNQWHHVSHEFRNYGPGLRKITFYHGGMDNAFWAGHYGSKMAGACVRVQIPEVNRRDSKETDLLDIE